MRILYLYAHPLPESFHGAIRNDALACLKAAGHDVDLIDLYEDGFNPVLSADRRRNYHNLTLNRAGLEDYIEKLHRAEAIVVQFPTWSFGPPVILKGFLDQMMKPGIAFDLSNPGKAVPLLQNIRHVHGIVTYGRPRLHAFFVGDGPRHLVKRYLRWFAHPKAKVCYHALYHMNVATDADRKSFMARVRDAMTKL